jgi:hypothetical protein
MKKLITKESLWDLVWIKGNGFTIDFKNNVNPNDSRYERYLGIIDTYVQFLLRKEFYQKAFR